MLRLSEDGQVLTNMTWQFQDSDLEDYCLMLLAAH